ncbi:hypothetical protein [Pantoea sp. QMID1]|uniref:hypothetical protein n=1 Tax=Pantoea sp. QMID1 TaxID=3016790 RepID=UPI0025561E51|nr:hypothetical protein [Pantoea sp. QMID1]
MQQQKNRGRKMATTTEQVQKITEEKQRGDSQFVDGSRTHLHDFEEAEAGRK